MAAWNVYSWWDVYLGGTELAAKEWNTVDGSNEVFLGETEGFL